MLASEFINGADGVRGTLLDAAKRTWSDPTLVGFLNQAIRTTCELKPNAFTLREFIPLQYGTRQELPEAGLAIFELDENEGSGRRATLVEKALLDHQNRFWPTATHTRDVEHWCADERDPRRFHVTPPNNGYGAVSCLYGALPADITIDDPIPLQDGYHYALRCFVLAQAYSQNTQRQAPAKAAALMADYRGTLGLRNQGQAALAPTVTRESSGA